MSGCPAATCATTSAGGRTSSAHASHTVRTSRWARIPSTVAATRYGSMPMSTMRVTPAGASFVWRVEHQVAGQGRLDRDLRRLPVAHLTDHDDVGVVPQDGPQRGGEREADLRVHGDLRDPVHLEIG